MRKTPPAQLEARKARYAARKAAGRCVRCGAGLQDTDLTLECVECVAAHAASMARYVATDHGRAAGNAEARRRRARWFADGRCVECGRKHAGPTKKCEPCLEKHRVNGAAYLDRKEQADANL